MNNKLFYEYRFKFYLNAGHSIIINGNQGAAHPHTWEFVLDILVPRKDFTEFNVFEKTVSQFFSRYQNQTMNDVEPFDSIVPTLENMMDYFGTELQRLIRETGGELLRLEGSETPTRSCIITYTEDSEYLNSIRALSKNSMSDVMDKMLDDILA